jgi:hypothetical protein
VLSARAWDLTQRPADTVPITLWVEEWIDVAQGVVGIGDIQQAGFTTSFGQDTMDGIGGDHLAHVADVDLPRWGDPGIHHVASTTLADDVIGEEISPVLCLRCRGH